jgi:hypothetical protein
VVIFSSSDAATADEEARATVMIPGTIGTLFQISHSENEFQEHHIFLQVRSGGGCAASPMQLGSTGS